MAGIRLGGIASGMDTESMVKQMVAARRSRVDRYTKKATKNEWVTEAYNEVNKSLANFVLKARKDLGLTDVGFFGNLKQNSIDKVDWANKAVSSNESVFTAKASSKATQGSYDIAVHELAKNASVSGTQMEKIKGDTKLSELDLKLEKEDANGNFNIKVNGKDITLNKKMRVSDAMAEIRAKAEININFDSGSHMLFAASKKPGGKNIINFGGYGEVKGPDGVVVTPAKVDENTKALFKSLGLDDKNIGKDEKGQDAIITFDNSNKIHYDSNNISINGIDLTLNEVSKKVDGKYVPTKLTVETDVDSIYNKIKGFVDEYNKIIDDLQGKLSEKSFRDFQPLTKEERGELKEQDIKNWDEKAKSGLLKEDKVIRNMISDIRKGLYEKVHSTYDEEGKNEKGSEMGSMYELGITTGNWRDGAKLKIDENKLKDAIKKDPNKVLDVLFQASDDKRIVINKNDSPEERARKQAMIDNKRAETGVFVRIMDSVSVGMENIVKHSGTGKNTDLLTKVNGTILNDFKTSMGGVSRLKQDLNSINKFVKRETDRLKDYEESLWKKFSAMEKALAKAQQQGSWIAQQLGGGM